MCLQTIKCPCCGAGLPGEASFCPHCAQSVNRRFRAGRLRAFPRRMLLLLPAALAVALVLLAGFAAQPKVLNGREEVRYTDADGTYRLTLSWAGALDGAPAASIRQTAADGQSSSFQIRLQVSHVETGANANAAFQRKIQWADLTLNPPEEELGTVRCDPPARPYDDDSAALVSMVEYTARGDFSTRICWTIQMDNGDQIRMYQDLEVEAAPVYDIYPEDADMSTIGALQKLVDHLDERVEGNAMITLHLPPVTYEGGLVIRSRAVSLTGSTLGDARTTFTGPVRIDLPADTWICDLRGIDFRGSGGGVAVSTSAWARAEDCSFTGWDTGLLACGQSWVSASGCLFSQNGVGLHFNSRADGAGYPIYDGNSFLSNGVAVLLEQVPSGETLDFRDSLFAGNGTDIDNRCGQSLEIAQAIFQ